MDFKELYESMKLSELCKRFPDKDESWVKRIWYQSSIKYKPSKKAGDVERNVTEFVRLLGHQCSKITTSGRMLNGKKTVTDVIGRERMVGSQTYIPGNSTKGVADLILTVYGLKWDVEIKYSKGDRQRKSQKKYEAAVLKANGLYSIVKNEDDFLRQYNEFLELPQVKLMKDFHDVNN